MRSLLLAIIFATTWTGRVFAASQGISVIEYEKPFTSHSLAGTILDFNGAPVEQAVVQDCDEKWDHCFGGVETDLKGKFSFPQSAAGKHFLRISKDGFRPSWIVLIVDKKSKKSLSLKLYIAN